MKIEPVFIALTIAIVYALFKGFIWPDRTSRYPIIDGALMLAGFLVATRGSLDLLFGGDSLRAGVVEYPRRNRLILGGVVIGVALCAIFDLSTR